VFTVQSVKNRNFPQKNPKNSKKNPILVLKKKFKKISSSTYFLTGGRRILAPQESFSPIQLRLVRFFADKQTDGADSKYKGAFFCFFTSGVACSTGLGHVFNPSEADSFTCSRIYINLKF
jgi:hypothetical protein